MVVRRGKFGKFLACPSYPSCKSTLPMPEENAEKVVGKCPECGNAMNERKSKKGKVYYSCSSYPACKYMSWDIPTGERCEKCGSPMVQSARGKVKCSSKECIEKERAEQKAKKLAEKPSKATKSAKTTAKKEKAKFETDFDDEFDIPPLMDEPQYFGPQGR